jgi:hypothetical protein
LINHPFGEIGVVVLAAQDDLERPGAAQKARQVLDAACAGNQTQTLLRLTEHRRLSRGKRMSHPRTNSLPAPRTRPSICAIVTRRLALR